MNFKKLKGNQRYYLVPSNGQTMMTGVARASQDKDGVIHLEYTDGTSESADCSDYEMQDKGLFSIVGDVQSRARKSLSRK